MSSEFLDPDFPKSEMKEGEEELMPAEKEVFSLLKRLRSELPNEKDMKIALSTLCRYFLEGKEGTYRSNPVALVQLIKSKKMLENSGGAIDLGAGSGDLLHWLALVYPEKKFFGTDLSPTFVEEFNRMRAPNSEMFVDVIDSRVTTLSMALRKDVRLSVFSVLTLDRLTRPINLIQNMAAFNETKLIGTLLPIVPEDDNPSRKGKGKIVYTRKENRIAPGRDADEDRDALLKLLRKEWKRPINFEEVPYTVESSGDKQDYNLGVFYTS